MPPPDGRVAPIRRRPTDPRAQWPGAPDALHAFPVYPRPKGRLYIRVEIYATCEALQQAVRAEARVGGTRYRTRGLIAMVAGLTERRGPTYNHELLPCFAIMRLPATHLTMSTITHECFHATMRWAARVGIAVLDTNGTANGNNNLKWPVPVQTAEEDCATAIDEIARQIVWRCTRLKLIP